MAISPGFGAVLVVLFTPSRHCWRWSRPVRRCPSLPPLPPPPQPFNRLSAPAARCTAAFVLLASSFGPTLALSALPANLTQTFAAARRLFALMDETPAVEERGDFLRATMACPCTTSRSATAIRARLQLPEAMRMPPSRPPSQSSTTSRSTFPQHGILGVQGPSGRGKSTLLKLLMRYWDPQSGLVALSEVPLPRSTRIIAVACKR